ncbi:hypothetical protein OCV73_14235 [Barnesiella propionica]|uniref:hypothetical protein n=1 Tax=Barnesiella propionica TaxID=2981781 RepID=UPI0011C7B2D8|nr:hypothetical protein [Barnesiella propionica]MCU6770094.1 hypothetical protein [Barnesiella propionica]
MFERITAVDCHEIIYLPEKVDTLEDERFLPTSQCILESIITDKEVLREILIELDERKILKSDYMDARMKCYISYSDGQIDSLCISSISNYGNYNGQPVKLTNKLIYLIRENCGFYRWIGADYLKYFDELNDTTFVREKVKSRYGGEY